MTSPRSKRTFAKLCGAISKRMQCRASYACTSLAIRSSPFEIAARYLRRRSGEAAGSPRIFKLTSSWQPPALNANDGVGAAPRHDPTASRTEARHLGGDSGRSRGGAEYYPRRPLGTSLRLIALAAICVNLRNLRMNVLYAAAFVA